MLRRISNSSGTVALIDTSRPLPDALAPEWIRVFRVFRLPVRLRIGATLHFSSQDNVNQILFITNSPTDWDQSKRLPSENFNSVVVACEKLTRSEPELLSALHREISSAVPVEFHNPQMDFDPSDLLRDFFASYALLDSHYGFREADLAGAFSGGSRGYHFEGLRIDAGFVIAPPEVENATIFGPSFSKVNPPHTFGRIAEEAHLWESAGRDLPPQQVAQLESRSKDVADHAYLKFGLTALSHAFRGDYATALLIACAATEGTLGRLLRGGVIEASASRGFEKGIDEFTSDLLMKSGASLMLRLVPLFCMKPDSVPPEEMIEACRKGFSARNHIMHHIEKKNRSAADYVSATRFSDHYGSVFKYYLHMRRYLHGY